MTADVRDKADIMSSRRRTASFTSQGKGDYEDSINNEIIRAIDHKISDNVSVKSEMIGRISREKEKFKEVLSFLEKGPLEGEIEISGTKIKLAELTNDLRKIFQEKTAYLEVQEKDMVTHFENEKAELKASKAVFTFDNIESMLKKTPIQKIEGIGDLIAAKFVKNGIITLYDLLSAGRTTTDRLNLSKKTQMSPRRIDEWVGIADLFRLSNMDTQFSELLLRAGILTVADLVDRDPVELRDKLESANKKKKVGRIPGVSEIKTWIEESRIIGSAIE